MVNVINLLQTIIGQTAWLPRKGIGSFLTIEFGKPFLVVREPLARTGVHRSLSRRRLIVQGEQHLWLQADRWKLHSANSPISSEGEPADVSEALEVLAGQILTDVSITSVETLFEFEYGEKLILYADQDPQQVQWSLHWQTGESASFLNSGRVVLESGTSA